MIALETVSPSIWTFHLHDLFFLNLCVGTRMAVIRLSNGEIMVYSPVPCTQALKQEVSQLGPVKYIICPNSFHYLFAAEWQQNFPEAKLIASRHLKKKKKELKVDSFFEDALPPEITGDFLTQSITSFFHETVFFHKKDKVLITSDIVQNFKGSEHFLTALYLKMFRTENRITLPLPERAFYLFRFSKAREQFKTILSWPIEKIIIAHGDEIIKSDGQNALRQSLHWIL